MNISMLKGKIHRATVKQAELDVIPYPRTVGKCQY